MENIIGQDREFIENYKASEENLLRKQLEEIEKRSELEEQIEEMKILNKNLERTYESQLEQKNQQILFYENQLKNQQANQVQWENQERYMKKENKESKELIESLKREISEIQAKFLTEKNQFSDKLFKLSQENQSLSEEIQQNMKIIETFEKKKSTYQKEIENGRERLQEREREVAELKEQLAIPPVEELMLPGWDAASNSEVKREIQENLRENEAYLEELRKFKSENFEIQKENEKLKGKLEKNRKEINEIQEKQEREQRRTEERLEEVKRNYAQHEKENKEKLEWQKVQFDNELKKQEMKFEENKKKTAAIISSLQENSNKLSNQLIDYRKRFHQVNEKYTKLSHEVSEYKFNAVQQGNMKNKLEFYQNENKDLQGKLTEIQIQFKKMEERIFELEKINANLVDESNSQKNQIKSNEQTILRLKSENFECLTQIQGNKNEIELLNNQIQSNKQIISTLETELNNEHHEIRALNENIKKLHEIINEKHEKLMELEKQQVKADSQGRELLSESLSLKIEENQIELIQNQFNNQIKFLKENTEELKAQLNEKNDYFTLEIKKKNEIIEDKNREVQRMKLNEIKYVSNARQLENEMEKVKQEKERGLNELRFFKESAEFEKSQKLNLQEENKKITDKLQQITKELGTLQKTLDMNKQTISVHQQNFENLTQENMNWKNLHHQIKVQFDKQLQLVNDLQQQIQTSRSEFLNEKERDKKQLEIYKEITSNLQNQIRHIELDNESLIKINDSLKQDLLNLQKQIQERGFITQLNDVVDPINPNSVNGDFKQQINAIGGAEDRNLLMIDLLQKQLETANQTIGILEKEINVIRQREKEVGEREKNAQAEENRIKEIRNRTENELNEITLMMGESERRNQQLINQLQNNQIQLEYQLNEERNKVKELNELMLLEKNLMAKAKIGGEAGINENQAPRDLELERDHTNLINNLENEIKRLKEEHETRRKEIEREISEIQKEKQKIEKENEENKIYIKNQKEMEEILRRKLEEYQRLIFDMKTNSGEIEGQLQKTVEHLSLKLKKLNEAHEVQRQELEQVRKDTENKERERNIKEREKQEKERNKERENERRTEQMQEEFNSMQETNRKLLFEIQIKNSENFQLKNQIKTKEIENGMIENIEIQFGKITEENRKLNNELNEFRNSIGRFNVENQKLNGENEKMKEIIAKNEKVLRKNAEEIQELNKILENLRKESEFLNKLKNNQENQLKMKEKLEKERMELLFNQNNENQKSVALEDENFAVEYGKLFNQYKLAENKLNAQIQQLREQETRIQSLEQMLEDAKTKNQTISLKYSAGTKELTEKLGLLSNLFEEEKRNNEKAMKDKLEEAHWQFERIKNQLLNEKREKENQIEALKIQLDSLRDHLNEKEKEILLVNEKLKFNQMNERNSIFHENEQKEKFRKLETENLQHIQRINELERCLNEEKMNFIDLTKLIEEEIEKNKENLLSGDSRRGMEINNEIFNSLEKNYAEKMQEIQINSEKIQRNQEELIQFYISKLNEEKQEKEREKGEFHAEKFKLKRENEKLISEIQLMHQEKTQIFQQMKNNEFQSKQIDNSRVVQLKSLENQINHLEKVNFNQKQIIFQLENKMKEIQRLNEVQASQRLEEIKAQLGNENKMRANELIREIKEKTERMKELEQDYRLKEEENNYLIIQFAKAETENKQKEIHLQNQLGQLRNQENRFKNYEAKLRSLEGQITAKEKENEENQKLIRKTMEQLKLERDSKNELIQRINEFQSNYGKFKEEMENNEKDKLALLVLCEDSQFTLENKLKQIQIMETLLENLNDQIKTHEDHESKYNAKLLDDYKDLNAKYQDIIWKLNQSNQIIHSKNQIIENLETNSLQFTNLLQEKEKYIANLENKWNHHSQQQHMQQSRDSVEYKMKLEDLQKANEFLQLRLKDMERENGQLLAWKESHLTLANKFREIQSVSENQQKMSEQENLEKIEEVLVELGMKEIHLHENQKQIKALEAEIQQLRSIVRENQSSIQNLLREKAEIENQREELHRRANLSSAPVPQPDAHSASFFQQQNEIQLLKNQLARFHSENSQLNQLILNYQSQLETQLNSFSISQSSSFVSLFSHFSFFSLLFYSPIFPSLHLILYSSSLHHPFFIGFFSLHHISPNCKNESDK